ncbi:MAG: DUF885 domain-containing protein [Lachnospiraceae bacterium]|nr:DUF885 domain-containing protein [Lachnospiraceae bacterium]
MNKKLLSMVLAVVVSLSAVFTGCGTVTDPKEVFSEILEKAVSSVKARTGNAAEASEEVAEAAEEENAVPEEGEAETEAPEGEDEGQEAVPEGGQEDTESAFHAFTDSLMPTFFEGDTFDAHYYFMHPEDFGINIDEPGLPQFSYDEDDEYNSSYEEFLTESLAKMEEFSFDELSLQAQITYDVLKDYLETELLGCAYDYYYEPLGGTSGYQSQLPVMFAEYKFFSVDDAEDYLAYLEQMPAHFEDLLLYEQQKADHGLFMEDDLAQEVIDQIDSFLETEADEDNFLYVSFREKVEALDLTDEEKDELIARNKELAPNFYEAYRILKAGLEGLMGSNQYKGGLCYYPDGEGYYEYLIKSNVGTEMSPAELWDYLEEKETESFNELMMIYRKHPDVVDSFYSMEFPSSDPEEIMLMLIESANEKFPELSEVQYEIKYVDESLREYLNPAFYIIPPFGEGATNEIYINPEEDGSIPDDIWQTLSHEGYPGHLYQYNFWSSVNEYAIRRLTDPTGYAEGWAQHVEHQSYYFEGADKNVADFAHANDLATMALYGLMDLGIHYQGWSKEELGDFLEEQFGAQDEETITDLYNYLVGNPAEYMQYAAGEFEMMDIIDDYTEEGGVDMKEFYREYLEIGPGPFYIVRKYLGLD